MMTPSENRTKMMVGSRGWKRTEVTKRGEIIPYEKVLEETSS